MKIDILEKQQFFSHEPGVGCILPGTEWLVRIYPARIQFFLFNGLSPEPVENWDLNISGPLEQFTVISDLEKSTINVSGFAKNGYLRYLIRFDSTTGKVCVEFHKIPAETLEIFTDGVVHHISMAHPVKTMSKNLRQGILIEPYVRSSEKISCGNHKQSDWTLMKRRMDLTEILPLWHKLGLNFPCVEKIPEGEGAFELLRECESQIRGSHSDKLSDTWKNLFRVCFSDMFVPRLDDADCLGLLKRKTSLDASISPWIALSIGSRLIREQLIYQTNEHLQLLMALPPEMHCGRIVNVNLEGLNLSLEWSRKRVRRCLITAQVDKEFIVDFRKSTACRLSTSHEPKRVVSSGEKIFFRSHQTYQFDNFS